jgi:hypothetical protein
MSVPAGASPHSVSLGDHDAATRLANRLRPPDAGEAHPRLSERAARDPRERRPVAVLGGVNPYRGYGKVVGVVFAVLTMQFLSSGRNMVHESDFARELLWGELLLFVMVINVTNVAGFRVRQAPVKTG